MTVQELMDALEEHDPDALVVMLGYQGGVVLVEEVEDTLVDRLDVFGVTEPLLGEEAVVLKGSTEIY